MNVNEQLIAPCGMNCGICMAYLREKNKCPGCRVKDKNKPITRLRCRIKTCRKKKIFCFECSNFPCDKLRHLDKRYRTRYNMSMVENLEDIENKGIQKFIKAQYQKYKCSKCGGLICVHNKNCYGCDKVSLKKKPIR